MKKFLVVFIVLVFLLGLSMTPRYVFSEKDDYGYLQVYVRWGEKNNNQPVEGVSIELRETGTVSTTDSKGYSSVIRLKTNEVDSNTGKNIGYYTVSVSKSGAKNYEYRNVTVVSGTSATSPTVLNAFMVSGYGNEIVNESTQERTLPQTPGR